MATKKSTATKSNPKTPNNPVQVLKEATCSTLSGTDTAQLTYQILSDDAGDIYIKVTGNKGGGFWASENTPYAAIDDLIANIGGDESLILVEAKSQSLSAHRLRQFTHHIALGEPVFLMMS